MIFYLLLKYVRFMKFFLSFFLVGCTITSFVSARVVDLPIKGAAQVIAQLRDGDTLRMAPLGRYDFYDKGAIERNYYESNTTDILPKRLAILLYGLKDITILGQGATLVMHGRIQPLTIDSCQNIDVQDLRIDWDKPLSADGEVVDRTEKGFIVQVDTTQYPYSVVKNRVIFGAEGWSAPMFAMMEFRPRDEYGIAVIEPSTGDSYSWDYANADAVDLGEGRIFFAVGASAPNRPKLGNYVVMRHNERAHAGIFVQNSKDVSFDRIRIYHTGGLGILCQYSENLTFRNSSVWPNIAKGRYLSGHDDGFHLMGCRGKIIIKTCQWQGLMDDPINIHGTSVRIVEILADNKIKCRFMQPQSVGMEWGQVGNKVGFLDKETLRDLGNNSIKGYQKLSTTDFVVELSKKLTPQVKVGDALENLHWVPSDVLISHNIFGGCRARGLLLTVPAKTVIENNSFYSSGSAILISGDAANWYETGAVKDVLITGNTFYSICNTSHYQFGMGIISIDPEIPKPDPKYPFHKNIRIVGNRFETADNPLLYAKSVDGLVFKDNTVIRVNDYEPRLNGDREVVTVSCRNVTID